MLTFLIIYCIIFIWQRKNKKGSPEGTGLRSKTEDLSPSGDDSPFGEGARQTI